ncbi:MAG: hypothetical protein GY757_11990 [bacterium]|nr:hypothetical protein [bacterium]
MNKEQIITPVMLEKAKQYWTDKFSTEPGEVELPGDYPPAKERSEAVYKETLDKEMSRTLARISRGDELSLYVVMLTAFKILLHKLTGREDITVASPTLQKNRQHYNRFILLRDTATHRMSFKDILMTVKETAVQGYRMQY